MSGSEGGTIVTRWALILIASSSINLLYLWKIIKIIIKTSKLNLLCLPSVIVLSRHELILLRLKTTAPQALTCSICLWTNISKTSFSLGITDLFPFSLPLYAAVRTLDALRTFCNKLRSAHQVWMRPDYYLTQKEREVGWAALPKESLDLIFIRKITVRKIKAEFLAWASTHWLLL